MTPQHHLPADIERTSISIITRELDELGLTPPPETAAVVKRVITPLPISTTQKICALLPARCRPLSGPCRGVR